MAFPNIFEKEVTAQLISRISSLTPESKPLWGKMSVNQMLAHCNVSYAYVYEPEKFKPTPFVLKFFLKLFVKSTVVGEKPYQKSSQTAPDFIIKEEKNFEEEKSRLIAFMEKTQSLGSSYFDGKESHSFGKLTASEWNNLFYKHLDHHLGQFGV